LREKAMHLTGGDPGPVTHPYDDHTYDVWRERTSMSAEWSSGDVTLRAVPYFNVGRHALFDGFLSTDTASGLVVETQLRWDPVARLLLGSAVDRADGDAENRASGEVFAVRAKQSSSWYQELTTEPISGVAFVVGAREVVSPDDGLVLVYKGGARWCVAEGWVVRARVARNFRQPTLSERYLPFPTANPDLKPERSFNTDAGVKYTSARWEAEGAVYRNDVQNLIRYFGVWPAAEVVNIDQVTVVGAEGQLVIRDLGPFSLRMAGNAQDVGRYTKQNPSARGVFGMDAVHVAGTWTLRASLEGEWVHGLFMSNYAEDPIDDVFVMNLGVRGRRDAMDGSSVVEPYVVIRNLFDRRYAYVKDYVMPGRNLLGGLRWVL